MQAYLRWERAGRPASLSAAAVRSEWEAAAEELRQQLANGVPLSAIRARLEGGGVGVRVCGGLYGV